MVGLFNDFVVLWLWCLIFGLGLFQVSFGFVVCGWCLWVADVLGWLVVGVVVLIVDVVF